MFNFIFFTSFPFFFAFWVTVGYCDFSSWVFQVSFLESNQNLYLSEKSLFALFGQLQTNPINISQAIKKRPRSRKRL